ncbi:MAG: hypothetical protein N2578_04665, partial [Bdellovibrionaceae bacterium]|nr:hypothetical protein [Pseudobdellovibrionaceae bacterium]
AADVQGGYSVVRNHLFFGRAWDRFAFRLEGGSVNGSTGVLRSGQDVRQNGYGFALELEFPNPVSKWEFSTKAGIASGDDPATNDYEGFNFSRNYDVALLMFNHRQGSPALKIHSTEAIRDSSLGLTTSLDDEAIGNAVYLAPRLKYRWSERVDINNTFIFAQTVVRTLANVGMDVNLGWEWDLDLDWRMRDNFSWMARLGYMVPGSAWRGGTNNYDNSPNTGLEIKAALTF